MCGADLRGGLTLPITIKSAASDGIDFALRSASLDREAFEVALQQQLAMIEAALGPGDEAEDATAAFDQAAWSIWESERW